MVKLKNKMPPPAASARGKRMFTTRLPRLLGGRGYPIRDPTHLAPSPRVQWVLGCHGPGRLGTVPRGWPAQVARTPLFNYA